jgi:DNA-binding SARP family transcriptional activator
MAPAEIAAQVLGGFSLSCRGRRITARDFARSSAVRLLQLLLISDGQRVSREAAAEMLWPESLPEHSSVNLRKALHFARRTLRELCGADAIASDSAFLWINDDVRLDLDLERVNRANARLQSMQRGSPEHAQAQALALELGGSSLLPDTPYEDWLVGPRERAFERWQRLAWEAAEVALADEQPDRALELAERLLDRDPADEQAHQLAVRAHVGAGRLHAARRQLARCRSALAELGVEPSAQTEALVARRALPAGSLRTQLPEPAVPPLIGRQHELDVLESALDRASSTQPTVLLLRGPPGIGKSRLLAEVRRAAVADGYSAISLRGLEAAPRTPFAGLRAALQPLLRAQVADGWPEPARSGAAALEPGLRLSGADAIASEDALAAALEDVVHLAADGTPAVIVDDGQWLDEGSLRVISGLLRGGRPVLLAVAMRTDIGNEPEPVARLLDDLRRTDATDITVGPLRRRELEQLARHALDDQPLAGALVRELEVASAGNPLFCLELLQAARDDGRLARREAGWELENGAKLGVPRSVSRLVRAHAARLPAVARRILSMAAELGDPVDFDLILRATPEGDANQVLEALDTGIRSGLLREVGGEYAFSHPLFRSALRAAISRTGLARLHLDAARALASGIEPAHAAASSDEIDMRGVDALVVARHAAEAWRRGMADAIAPAVGFGLAAGRRLMELYDHAGGVDACLLALEAWRRMPADQRHEYPVSPTLVLYARSLTALGREDEAAADLRLAWQEARSPEEAAAAVGELAWLPYRHGRLDESRQRLADGLASLPDDAELARARLEQQLGWLELRQGRPAEAAAVLERSLETFERLGDESWVVQVLDKLGVAYHRLGDLHAAARSLERAVSIARSAGGLRGQIPPTIHVSGVYAELGLFERSRQAVARALELTQIVGEYYLRSVAHWEAAEMEQQAGNAEAAIEHRQRELELLRGLGGNPNHEAASLAHIAVLQQELGLTADAVRSADQALRHAALADRQRAEEVKALLRDSGFDVAGLMAPRA